MTRYRILSWRGIPTQLKVFTDEGRPRSVALDNWFVTEIDRVAMRDGLIGSDEYLQGFAWSDDLERPGTPDQVATELVDEIERAWMPHRRTQ